MKELNTLENSSLKLNYNAVDLSLVMKENRQNDVLKSNIENLNQIHPAGRIL